MRFLISVATVMALSGASAAVAGEAGWRPVATPELPAQFCSEAQKSAALQAIRANDAAARANEADAVRQLGEARREHAAYANTIDRARGPLRRAVDRGAMEQAAPLAMLIGDFQAEVDRLPQAVAALEEAAAHQRDLSAQLMALETRAMAMPPAKCRAGGRGS